MQLFTFNTRLHFKLKCHFTASSSQIWSQFTVCYLTPQNRCDHTPTQPPFIRFHPTINRNAVKYPVQAELKRKNTDWTCGFLPHSESRSKQQADRWPAPKHDVPSLCVSVEEEGSGTSHQTPKKDLSLEHFYVKTCCHRVFKPSDSSTWMRSIKLFSEGHVPLTLTCLPLLFFTVNSL